MSKHKVHIHSEQFDNHLHASCSRAGLRPKVAMPEVFEATDPYRRCKFCDREWFPQGQPRWHLEQAKKAQKK